MKVPGWLTTVAPLVGLVAAGVGVGVLYGWAWGVVVVGGALWLDGYLPAGR